MIFDVIERAQHDVQDCIGCNDCMIACPIPEKSFINITLLNDAVQQSTLHNHSVRDFVQACTQCQQCVPVCPADLSRANMVLFNKMKIEKENQDRLIPSVIRNSEGSEESWSTGWTIDTLQDWCQKQSIFVGLSEDTIRVLCHYASIVSLDFDEVLYKDGSYHENIYVLIDGSIQEISIQNKREVLLLVQEEGSIFGLEQVLHDSPTHYLTRSKDRSEVVRFHKAIIHRLRNTDKQFKKWLDDLYLRQTFSKHFQGESPFACFQEEDKKKLMEGAELKEFQDQQQIAEKGSRIEGLWLIKGGFIQVKDSVKVLNYFGPGDELGLLSFLPGQKHELDWFAVGRVFTLLIPRALYQTMLKRYPDTLTGLMKEGLSHEQRQVEHDIEIEPKSRNTTVGGLNFANVGRTGLLGADRVLVIDQEICNDCNACVDACEQRHGAPRLKRKGLQLNQYLFPSACRHCEDPKCLMCTVRGIQRKASGEIFIDPEGTCIGCGSCAERCPYDNISMVPRTQLQQSKSFVQKCVDIIFSSNKVGGESFWETGNLLSLLGVRPQRKNTAVQTGVGSIAVKCDLCTGYEYEACVHACPVGAAFRVTGQEVMEATLQEQE